MESAWGIKPGSWAEDVEQEEAKNGPLLDEAFPTLGEAVKEPKAPKAAGKKKPVKMALGDFMSSSSARRTASDKEILMALPKGSSGLPREERDSKALGGGFKDYGGNRDGAVPPVSHIVRHAVLHRSAGSFGSFICSAYLIILLSCCHVCSWKARMAVVRCSACWRVACPACHATAAAALDQSVHLGQCNLPPAASHACSAVLLSYFFHPGLLRLTLACCCFCNAFCAAVLLSYLPLLFVCRLQG
jgi:hypothetical protein